MNLRQAVNEAKEIAKKKAEECEKPGDPATHVWCELDGRTKFARQMRSEDIDGVSVDDDYKLRLSLLSGTDIQNHNKKRAMYKSFCEAIEERGFNTGYSIKQYAR